jgi:hypothetical protein
MGLDWNPGNRPLPGKEVEFFKLFDKLQSGSRWRRKAAEKRFFEISQSAFETLKAPQVGIDDSATQWARERYREQNPEMSEQEWLAELHGFYVVSLVPQCDGLPRYTNGQPGGYVEQFSFRAQFLEDAETIIGEELLTMAWGSKNPEEMHIYADLLEEKARDYASINGLDLNILDPNDLASDEFKLDVLVSAIRWIRFWADKGHVLDAYW